MEGLLMSIDSLNRLVNICVILFLFILALCFSSEINQVNGQERGVTEESHDQRFSQRDLQPGEDGKQDRILEIRVKGNERIESEVILLDVSSKVGEPLSSTKIKEDVKKIYESGAFDDVIAKVERTQDGVILVFEVKDKPIIVDLRIRGNDDIKSDDILEVVEVREGRVIDLSRVKKSEEAIKSLYSHKGFVDTRVSYSIEPEGKGTVSITYNVEEGDKAYIKKVVFIGNEKLKTKVIKKGIYSKPKGIFSFISKKGLYRLGEIENDSERIRITYIDNGFLDVKVGKPEIEYSDEKKGYIVTFKVEEGDQYKVSEVLFEGDLITSHQELKGLLRLKNGEIFRGSYLSQDISRLTTFYGDKGYAFANVEPNFSLDREKLTVDVRFNIEQGPEVYVKDIDIVGNTRTRDKVIRREISIQEEQLFNATEVQAIKPRISRLGFFEDNVEVLTERVIEKEDEVALKVKVKEKSTGFFSVAGGFSSVENFIFAGQIQEANLFGYGKRLSLNAQIGGVTQLFYINYQDPNLLDTDWTLGTLLFRTDRSYRDFDRKAFGGSVTVGRRLWGFLSGNATYRYEDVDIGGIEDEFISRITRSDRIISSFGIGLTWDSRNNLLDPSAGNLSNSNIEYSGIGGNTDFVKYTISSRQWIPFWFDTVLSVKGRYGMINLIDNGNDLVIGERFFLGGPYSLRGFGFRRVAPRLQTSESENDFVIIGGTQELLVSIDYIFPLINKVGLKGVIFLDMGNVFNDGEDLAFNPADLKRDAGFGVKWISPLGPLRLEVGFPIGDRLSEEDSYEVQFTVGTLF